MSVREFESGATRSALGDKYCYSGFCDALVKKRFGAYMHKHRRQEDGTLREPDNWKKGIPIPSLVDSLHRHHQDVELWHQGYVDEMSEDIEDSLCAVLFNTQALLLEILRGKRELS